jgi:hypothetical protein
MQIGRVVAGIAVSAAVLVGANRNGRPDDPVFSARGKP